MLRPYSEVEQAEVEQVDLEAALALDRAPGDLDQPEGLRHLAGAGLVAARRAVDQQDARTRRRLLRRSARRRRRAPRHRRELVSGSAKPGPAGCAATCASSCRPGGVDDPGDLACRARRPDRRSAREPPANSALLSATLGMPLRTSACGSSPAGRIALTPGCGNRLQGLEVRGGGRQRLALDRAVVADQLQPRGVSTAPPPACRRSGR